ncbi:MAG TPA: biopolymer transporter ExbD [Burkholderiaceae bacterium]|nr:biopolymer transporter ExbD [Burkholderiaceae bacterium]
MARRVRKKHHAELEITAFLNLIVVLVPFLLSTTVFTRLSVLDLSLPAKSSGVEQLKTNNLQLEVVIRTDALEVGDRIGGLIERVPNINNAPDTRRLGEILREVKKQFPDKAEATVLAEPNTSYEMLVRVMDAMRTTHTVEGAKVVRADLFPQISVGDAPISTKGKGS